MGSDEENKSCVFCQTPIKCPSGSMKNYRQHLVDVHKIENQKCVQLVANRVKKGEEAGPPPPTSSSSASTAVNSAGIRTKPTKKENLDNQFMIWCESISFKCRKCPKFNSARKDLFRRHYKRAHADEDESEADVMLRDTGKICRICGIKFKGSKPAAEQHFKSECDGQITALEYFNSYIKGRRAVNWNVRSDLEAAETWVGKKKTFRCQICDASFPSEVAEIKKHLEIHSGSLTRYHDIFKRSPKIVVKPLSSQEPVQDARKVIQGLTTMTKRKPESQLQQPEAKKSKPNAESSSSTSKSVPENKDALGSLIGKLTDGHLKQYLLFLCYGFPTDEERSKQSIIDIHPALYWASNCATGCSECKLDLTEDPEVGEMAMEPFKIPNYVSNKVHKCKLCNEEVAHTSEEIENHLINQHEEMNLIDYFDDYIMKQLITEKTGWIESLAKKGEPLKCQICDKSVKVQPKEVTKKKDKKREPIKRHFNKVHGISPVRYYLYFVKSCSEDLPSGSSKPEEIQEKEPNTQQEDTEAVAAAEIETEKNPDQDHADPPELVAETTDDVPEPTEDDPEPPQLPPESSLEKEDESEPSKETEENQAPAEPETSPVESDESPLSPEPSKVPEEVGENRKKQETAVIDEFLADSPESGANYDGDDDEEMVDDPPAVDSPMSTHSEPMAEVDDEPQEGFMDGCLFTCLLCKETNFQLQKEFATHISDKHDFRDIYDYYKHVGNPFLLLKLLSCGICSATIIHERDEIQHHLSSHNVGAVEYFKEYMM